MERAAFTIYLIILLLSILMFGAVHTYVYTLMTLGVLTATLLVILKSIRKDHRSGIYQVRLPRNSLHIGFIILLGFLIFQMVPMPDSVLDFLSPEASVLGDKSLPAHGMLNPGEKDRPWFSLAAYSYPVRLSIIRLVVYGLFFFGLIRTLNSQKRINVTISILLAIGCFEALYALIQTYSGSYHVLWYKMVYGKERLKGTYINSNHFAGFMAMGVVLASAFAGALAARKESSQTDSKRKPRLSSRISSFLSAEQDLSKRILVGFAGVVMGISLIFSASRGAILSWAGAMFLMGVLLVLRRNYRRKGAIFIGIFVLICAYAVQIGVEYPLQRFMQMESGFESRSRYAAKTMDLFEDFKVVGVGVGNFQYAFPKYQAEKDKKKFYLFAHNDWAQYLSEGGIVGLCLLIGGFGFYIFKTLRLWARRKDPYAISLGIAPIAVMTYMAIHSYSDFNLHIPANVLILVAVMAIGYAALHLERHRRRDRMNYRYYELPLKYRGGVALVLIFGLIGWSGWWTIKHFMAEAYCNTVPNSTLNRDPRPPVEEIVKAIEWDGGNAEYHFKLAEELEREGVNGYLLLVNGEKTSADYADYAEKKNQDQKEIIGALEEAVELNPFEAGYHLRLGWEYAHLWKEPDYHTKWLPAADISMDRAAYFAGVKNPYLHQELGNYWTMRSKSVYPNNPIHHEAWAKACWHYQKALSIERGEQSAESKALKRIKKEIHDYVWNFYPDEDMVKQSLNVSRKAGEAQR
ncbi:MAG: O-antigen ligase family protein [Thermodesulfobacteriota bacterium]|nr:O-antigen ligase family protein [Thermodesulfobacteriota bacterium]